MLINMDAVHQTYIVCRKTDLRRGIVKFNSFKIKWIVLY